GLAGSSWSYAATSTIRPPTPSTSSVAPISSGATSWTLRAKKSRFSMRLRVVAEKRRKRSREEQAARNACDAPRNDREAEAGHRRERARFEVPERRRCGDLHELDPGDTTEHRLGSDPVEHDRAQDRADLIAEAGQRQQQQCQPELLGEAEGRDRQPPQRRGDDDSETLAANMP